MLFSHRILKFSDSHYTRPAHIEKLEDGGRQGEIILVEGVKTGSAFVWAKLRDPAYSVSETYVLSCDAVRLINVSS